MHDASVASPGNVAKSLAEMAKSKDYQKIDDSEGGGCCRFFEFTKRCEGLFAISRCRPAVTLKKLCHRTDVLVSPKSTRQWTAELTTQLFNAGPARFFSGSMDDVEEFYSQRFVSSHISYNQTIFDKAEIPS